MNYKTYGKLRMFSAWEFDKSIFGHALEAAGVAAAIALFRVEVMGDTFRHGFYVGAFIMLCVYWGREKRDCETGMKLPSGSPLAWVFMWWRPRNILDMLGPIVVFVWAWWTI